MDAVFGLPRRKNAGISHRDSLHGSKWFLNQTFVDTYVRNQNNSALKSDVCKTQ